MVKIGISFSPQIQFFLCVPIEREGGLLWEIAQISWNPNGAGVWTAEMRSSPLQHHTDQSKGCKDKAADAFAAEIVRKGEE